MVQDRQGFTWIGTAVGLNRFDGYAFELFTHEAGSKTSLSGDSIYALHVDDRSRLWVGTDQGLDLFDPSTKTFRHFAEAVLTDPKRRGRFRAIHSDSAGNLWLAYAETPPGISHVVRFNPATGELRRYSPPWLSGGEIVMVRAQNDRRILVVARDPAGHSFPHGFAAGILDPVTGTSRRLMPRTPVPAPLRADERDISLASAGPDSLWVGAPGHQIFRLNLASGEVIPRAYDPALADASPADLVSHVAAGSNGELVVVPTWRRPVRRSGGSSIYSLTSDGELLRTSSMRPTGACDFTRSFVISSLIDRTGILWTGISGSGLCVTDLQSGMFSHLHESSTGVTLNNNFVRSVWKTPAGILWVGTRSGLNRIDRARAVSEVFRTRPGQPGGLSDDEVRAILVDRSGALWVGTQSGGLNRSANQGASFEHFRHDAANPRSISANGVSALLEDRSGSLWIATLGGGLNRFHPADRSFSAFRHMPGDPTSLGSDTVTTVFEDSSGQMWVGTEDAGLHRFDSSSGRFSPVDLHLDGAPNIVSMTEDPRTSGVIWIATLRNGLVRYQPASGQSRWFTAQNSLLPSSTVYSVVSDAGGFVWAGTNRGLVRIDPRDDSFRIFATDQGLQSMEFNTRACFRALDGELFFGGIGGLNAFYPDSITQNGLPPSVVITEVRALNPRRGGTSGLYEVVYRNDGSSPSSDLPAGRRELIFSYVALHYSDPTRNRYRVMLEGFDEDWRDVGVVREATYTNLSPGSYRFLVKAVTSRGVWGEQQAVYSFSIARPFYQQPWFYVLVISAAWAAGFLTHRWRLRALRAAKRALETQVEERTTELTKALSVIGEQADQLRETDALKSRFITNFSHDFRTPLTVTLGTLADILAGSHGPITSEIGEQLETVMRNDRRLLRLVNQMVAIARLDSGKLRLQVIETDLAALARGIVAAFRPAAQRKAISLEFAGGGPVPVYCDRDWTHQAVTNLVANALKFTPPGGRVEVAVGTEAETLRIYLSVKDSGPGIAAEEAPRIFDRFYQTELGAATPYPGLGVGLSLAKEIVELHRGEISVASSPGCGATFRISFLPGKDHYDPDQLPAASPPQPAGMELESLVGDLLWEEFATEETQDAGSDKPLLLIAEDDRDLREYLRRHLRDDYLLLLAPSGDAAWKLIRSETPDLVISDIMMPGMNGYQLCREMRSCPETDFIPVVLLTAKAETSEKIEGLDCGADDYLTKPFEIAELHARIRNLLQRHDRLRTRIAAELALDAATSLDPVPDSADGAFLHRVYETIRRHAHQQDFSVEQMAKELAMSRMHLYRRLTALVGKPPAEVLIEYRLQRAGELLAAQSGSVSEVAYGLGFKSVSHFTRRFREKFGRTPSEHRALRRDQGPSRQNRGEVEPE